MRKHFGMALLLAAGLISGGGAKAQDKTGIILMHGKAGSPEHLRNLAADLTHAGYLVVTPEMPWSKARGYDETLQEAHGDIGNLIAGLKKQGAARIVIAGHSMGANMAMGYAATHGDVAAVMAIGPGQTVESENFRKALGESVARARTMIAEGKGATRVTFADLHLAKIVTAETTAPIYLSYFDPEGLANMPEMAKRIGVPLLWVVGTLDKNMLDRGRAYAFDHVPANPLNRYAEVHADHMGTPDAASPMILEWLEMLSSRTRPVR